MTIDTDPPLHVGIVSLGYPPLPHVAALRAGHFSTELADLGARVTVYTTSCPDQPARPSDDDDHIRVVRAPSPAMTLGTTAPEGNAVVRKALTTARRFGDGAYGEWVRQMVANVTGSAQTTRGCPQVLWAIHGSDSAHALARRLAHDMQIPWIADYKDNWDHGTNGLTRGAAYVAHRRRTASAAVYTAASRLGAQHLRDVFGRYAVPIYTGVDVEAWKCRAPADLGSKFNLVFTGHASTSAMATTILGEGIVQAMRRLPPDTVALHYFGHRPSWLRQYLVDAGFASSFVDHGFADREDVVRAQKAGDLLLYLPYVEVPLICVKFFEYLASGRPILSVPEERDPWGAADGLLVAHTEAEVADSITDEVHRWMTQGSPPSFERNLSAYAWRPQAERLFSLLVGLAEGDPQSQRTHSVS